MMKRRYVITTTQIIYFFIVMTMVLISTQFHVESTDNMDFARHMMRIQYVGESDLSLSQFLFGDGHSFTTNISVKYCYAFNLITYLAGKYLKNYYIIVWLFILVDYSIIAYIGVDWWKEQKRKKVVTRVFEMLICFSLLPYIHAVSGLRSAIASCIMALALYKYLYKDERLIKVLFLTCIAVMFHPSILLAVPFAILAKKANRKLGLIISMCLRPLISLTARLLIHSSNPALYAIAFKYLQYTGEDGFRGTRFCYYGVIVICILVLFQYLILYFLKRKNRKKGFIQDKREYVFDFIAYYMIYTLSNIGDYELVMRQGYLLGALAPIITDMIFSKPYRTSRYIHIISWALNVMLYVIITYVSVKYVYRYGQFFV